MLPKNDVPHVHGDRNQISERVARFIEATPSDRQRAVAELRFRAASNEAGAFMPALLLLTPTVVALIAAFGTAQTLWATEISRTASIFQDVSLAYPGESAHQRYAQHAIHLALNSHQAEQTSWLVLYGGLVLISAALGFVALAKYRDQRRAIATMWLGAYADGQDLLNEREMDSMARDAGPAKLWGR